jgi:hypothetical protein
MPSVGESFNKWRRAHSFCHCSGRRLCLREAGPATFVARQQGKQNCESACACYRPAGSAAARSLRLLSSPALFARCNGWQWRSTIPKWCLRTWLFRHRRFPFWVLHAEITGGYPIRKDSHRDVATFLLDGTNTVVNIEMPDYGRAFGPSPALERRKARIRRIVRWSQLI